MSVAGLAVADSLVIARRNLLRIRFAPDLLLAFTIQPVMFVLLFVYVFGGAIRVPGFSYVNFLMPGIITQNITFGGFLTAVGLREDLNRGLIDRFRSLPMSRSAVLAGRTLADVVMNLLATLVMIAVGLLVGFRFQTNLAEVVAGVGLLLLFGYAFSWIFALVGLTAGTPESAQAIGFTVMFPVTFVSSAFVPVDSMPAALRAFARYNPITIVCDAMRALFLGTPANNAIWEAVAWSVGLAVVFAVVAVMRYRRIAAR